MKSSFFEFPGLGCPIRNSNTMSKTKKTARKRQGECEWCASSYRGGVTSEVVGCKVDFWPSRTCHVSGDRVFWASSKDMRMRRDVRWLRMSQTHIFSNIGSTKRNHVDKGEEGGVGNSRAVSAGKFTRHPV